MSPIELQRLEEIVDEARHIRLQLQLIAKMRERMLEICDSQPIGSKRTIMIIVKHDVCELQYSDACGNTLGNFAPMGIPEGIEMLEALLVCITHQQNKLQKKLEGLKV